MSATQFRTNSLAERRTKPGLPCLTMCLGPPRSVTVLSNSQMSLKEAEQPSPPEIAAEPLRVRAMAHHVNAVVEKVFGL